MLIPSLKLSNKELAMRHGLRRLDPMHFKKAIDANQPGAPPKPIDLAPYQLVVNEEYQRDLSDTSRRRIRAMATGWSWSKYKTISVVPCDDVVTEEAGTQLYEVIDGQHTAIAAATNGNIAKLPCLLHERGQLADQAKSFIGMNREKIGVTALAMFGAEIAAGSETAISIQLAMSYAGITLLEVPPTKGIYLPGQTMALGSMKQLCREQGESQLIRVMKVARASEAKPITANLIKALAIILKKGEVSDDARIIEVIKGQTAERLEIIARAECPKGERYYMYLADLIRRYAGQSA